MDAPDTAAGVGDIEGVPIYVYGADRGNRGYIGMVTERVGDRLTQLERVWLVSGLFVAAVLLARWVIARGQRRRLRAWHMTFSRDLETEDVTRCFAGLRGLLVPWWQRLLLTNPVLVEVHADRTGIRHVLLAPAEIADRVVSQLRATLPSVRLDPCEPPELSVGFAGELALSTRRRPLRTDRIATTTSAVLAAPAAAACRRASGGAVGADARCAGAAATVAPAD